ncbi:hypothetical protein OGAPHI_003866 [Ogataea philodendri]|uniref:Uncharacterized protein n=1 Tax=Ogataea philodendri TaxID=1378263 RepID=A0A9P8P4L7_9ASCO|nr:uncharacterized protein OGAPHI_003866 [Ogataea philodendri]KAH3665678.1 hypothetical protein OGAPHI_003866 [Ogataea philodendri]
METSQVSSSLGSGSSLKNLPTTDRSSASISRSHLGDMGSTFSSMTWNSSSSSDSASVRYCGVCFVSSSSTAISSSVSSSYSS